MSVEFQDYYSVLGVDRNASDKDIQKAYRKLAREYHPDLNKNAGAEDKFKKINEANEVIGNAVNRKRYDTLGANWKAGQQFQPPPGWENIFAGFGGQGAGQSFQFNSSGRAGSGQGLGGFSDFFQMLFAGDSGGDSFVKGFGGFDQSGGPNPQAHARTGESLRAEISVSLEEAYHGTTKSVSFQISQNGFGPPQPKSYQVKIPPGTANGSTIRLSGQGAKGSGGGKAGDLLLKIRITPHPKYRLRKSDLLFTLPISPWEAALGTKIDVPTLDGKVSLSVPPGAQSGQTLRLRGKGMSRKSSEQGNMLVELKIVLPDKLNSKEKKLFEQLSEESSFNPRKGL